MKYLKMGLTIFIAVYFAILASDLTKLVIGVSMANSVFNNLFNKTKFNNNKVDKTYEERLAESQRAIREMNNKNKGNTIRYEEMTAKRKSQLERSKRKRDSDMRTCKFWIDEHRKAIKRESNYTLEYTRMLKTSACEKVGL